MTDYLRCKRQVRLFVPKWAKNFGSHPLFSPCPPPQNEKLARTWHFEVWLPKNTPPNEKLARTWHFEFWLPKNIPPPQTETLVRTWHFQFWLTQEYPAPPMKHWPELGTLSFDYPGIHPPPKWKIGQNLALWVLTTQEYSPPNGLLVRTWHFEFWLPKNTSYPQWNFGQNFALWFWLPKNTPQPKEKLLLKCVETNCCIPQEYHLVFLVWN